jgi:hypothetical protein
MAKDYIGVRQNQKSGKWKYSIFKRNGLRIGWQGQEFDSAKEAALCREMHILRDKLDTDAKGNERNFSDKKFKKLNKKRKVENKGIIFGKKKVAKKKDTKKKDLEKKGKKKKK